MIRDPESRSKRRDESRRAVRESEARRWEIVTAVFIAACILAVVGWRAMRECRTSQQLWHFCSIPEAQAWLASGADPMFWIYAGIMMALACAAIVLAVLRKLL